MKNKLLGPKATIHSIIFDKTDTFCYAAGDDSVIHQWQIKPQSNSEPNHSMRLDSHQKRIFQLVNHPTLNQFLSLGEDKIIKFWDSQELKIRNEINAPKPCVKIIFFPHQKMAVSLTGNNHLYIWDISNWTLIQDIPINNGQMGVLDGKDIQNNMILSSYNVDSFPIWSWIIK